MTDAPSAVPARHRRRRGLYIRKGTPPGSAPGTIAVDPAAPRPRVTLFAFDQHHCEERTIGDPQQIAPYLGKGFLVWVNVDGLGDATILQRIAELFGMHALALEDVVHTHQRPKVEPYGETMFIVTRMVHAGEQLETEQISMLLGPRFLLTFQERPGDCLDPVRSRIRKPFSKLRTSGPDYLMYAILDALLDDYFPALEVYGEQIEDLELRITTRPTPELMARIHHARRNLMILRRALWPQRDMINTLLKEHSSLITDGTRVYLRDCYDHVVQMIDLVENYRELAGSLMEVFLTSISNRMNEVMKVLTVTATIFIPLTFVTGLYGMNFDTAVSPYNMPELEWYYGYPAVLALMFVLGIGMLAYFRHRGWIGNAGARRRDSQEL